jgi:hypothetical protein
VPESATNLVVPELAPPRAGRYGADPRGGRPRQRWVDEPEPARAAGMAGSSGQLEEGDEMQRIFYFLKIFNWTDMWGPV